MASFMKSIRRLEAKSDRKAERFVFNHPYLGFFAMFLIMPILILATVAAITMLIALPTAFLFCWM